jgi:starvation-inducible DNA-binding protein
MFTSPNQLSEQVRTAMVDELNARLADGLDLYSQIKVAHWNLKGPQFAALHPLFEKFASDLLERTDEMAERSVTLGGIARGTVRHVSKYSNLPDYPQETVADLDHVRLLAERFNRFLTGMRLSRTKSEELGDDDTLDLCTQVIREFEKHAWFLHATLEGSVKASAHVRAA